jgi:8-oxo-dGTP pyrophosphatase MutT (NUDIX family)
MSKNRGMWKNSEVFPNSLSQKSSSSDSDTEPSSKKQKIDSTAGTPEKEGETSAAQTWGPGHEGCTYELCAGLVDKDLPLELIAKEEILEETGYDVPAESLERISWHHSSIGTAGTKMYLFYCEVTDAMLINSGGGNTTEGESIEVVYVPLEKSLETVFDDTLSKSSSLCFGFLWFDKYKRHLLNNT